jgi:Ca2+-binding RTX toxin-like protein
MPILIALILLLAVPAAAHATTTVSLSNDGQVLSLSGDGFVSTLEVHPYTEGSDMSYVEVISYFDPFAGQDLADYFAAGTNCTEVNTGSPARVRCGPTAPTRSVAGTLGGGEDYVQVLAGFPGGVTLDGGSEDDTIDPYAGAGSSSAPVHLTGGAGHDTLGGESGDDVLEGGPGVDSLRGNGGNDELSGDEDGDTLIGDAGVDTLTGGDGADTLAGGSENDDLDGEGGNDDLTGGAGDDALDGGGADDLIHEGAGQDTVVGGAGEDTATYELESYDVTTITLDDSANDGGPGEQDNLRSDVENVTTANGGDTSSVTGSAVRNEINAFADRNTVNGGAGDDYINATCYPNCVHGGDDVDGGPGNDEIRTGDGPDEIVGGPGQDEIYADNCSSFTCSEPDRIEVVDGEPDDVYCGGGGDVVRADPVDQLLMCDHVTIVKPGGGTPSGGGTPTGGGGPTGGGTPATTTTPPAATTPKRCRVPKLRKLTLAKAKQRLKKAGCRLGKVRKPRGARRLVVKKQSRKAGRSVPRGTRVSVTMAPR